MDNDKLWRDVLHPLRQTESQIIRLRMMARLKAQERFWLEMIARHGWDAVQRHHMQLDRILEAKINAFYGKESG